jgi:hypothetical protein
MPERQGVPANLQVLNLISTRSFIRARMTYKCLRTYHTVANLPLYNVRIVIAIAECLDSLQLPGDDTDTTYNQPTCMSSFKLRYATTTGIGIIAAVCRNRPAMGSRGKMQIGFTDDEKMRQPGTVKPSIELPEAVV